VSSSSRVWSVVVVFAALGFALGGCGTLSSSLTSESSVLASRAPVVAPAEPDFPAIADASAAAHVVITYDPVT